MSINCLSLLTLNTHSFQEEEGRFTKPYQIGLGLKQLQPDICVLNEVVYGSFFAWDGDGRYRDSLESIASGMGEVYAAYNALRLPFGRWEKGEQLANVILSRFPMLDSWSFTLTTTDRWPAPHSSRTCPAARLQLPDNKTCTVIAIHAMGHNSKDTSSQITEIKAHITELINSGEKLIFLLGDFNIAAGTPDYEKLIKEQPVFIDSFHTANPACFLQSSVYRENLRIDHILMADTPERAQIKSSEIIFCGADDPYDLPVVSDHFGLLTKVSLPF
jgi:endonuclease/exonuclease/phosphatase family metal-dependent hydrolase